LLLLAIELFDETAVLFFQLPQPANVRAIGSAHEVRQHMHVPERFLHDCVGRDRMTDKRPICARDVAALNRRVPHSAQRLFVLGFCKLLDRHCVAGVERLLQQLCSGLPAAGQHDSHDVKVVVVGSLGSGHLQMDEHAAQFAVR
jgi:hypothetical protein